jgi:hypothetical protein
VSVPATSAAIVKVAAAPSARAIVWAASNRFELSWSFGVLQSADALSGPYTDVIGAAAPYPVATTNAQQFYRVRGN